MNTETGELFRVQNDIDDKELLNELKKVHGDAVVLVPDELAEEAEQLLAGKDKVFVNLHNNTSLARWAAKKNKQRAAKASKKRNR